MTQPRNLAPIPFGEPACTKGISVFSKKFDEEFYYMGEDLGPSYGENKTILKLWAPTASEAYVVLYDDWVRGPAASYKMAAGERGLWEYILTGNYDGQIYTYRVKIGGQWNEAADPYAKAVAVNGDRSVIINLAKTNPPNWHCAKIPFEAATDAIIYELHIRDFSIHPASGIRFKGKFLGLAEEGTRGPKEILSGLDYLNYLGITHVQLMPIFDYCTESVDETMLTISQYNWGYDPKNYNVPEGSYATDPFDPAARIIELKQLIQTLHQNGLRVIMDVVYNHVYEAYKTSFGRLVPGYYFRYKPDGELANGSGCGNDTASERKMVRKFIVDSVLYWAKEYHLDGFRFDLMGLHDIDTMNEIRSKLNEIDPAIIMIGEGWRLETPLAEDAKANQANAAKMPGIAHFNNYLRDALRGGVFSWEEPGFISGKVDLVKEIKKGVAGGIAYNTDILSFAAEPNQTVNYAESHDNHTLWDKLLLTNGGDSEKIRRCMHRLATAIILTSQGISFLHAGQEFFRTKGGTENSYNSPTEVNQLDWQRCSDYQDDVKIVKQLISLRKSHPAFRMRTAAEIRTHLYFEQSPKNCLAYTLRNHANGDTARHLFIAHNANREHARLHLPHARSWECLFGSEEIIEYRDEELIIDGLSSVIMEYID